MSEATDREWIVDCLSWSQIQAGFVSGSDAESMADALLASDGWRTHVTEPFLDQRELHHFEVEQENAKLRAEMADLRARVEAMLLRPPREMFYGQLADGWFFATQKYGQLLRAALDATPAPDALARVRAEAGAAALRTLRDDLLTDSDQGTEVALGGVDWVTTYIDDRADRIERGDA